MTGENFVIPIRKKSIYFFTYLRHIILLLIHSADPQSRPVVIIVFVLVVCPSLRPHFLKSSKIKQISSENNVHYSPGETVGLAKWIIDENCLVPICFAPVQHLHFYGFAERVKPAFFN